MEGVVRYVAELQQPDGSFAGDEWGEIDTRFSFCALATLALLVSALHVQHMHVHACALATLAVRPCMCVLACTCTCREGWKL